MHLANRQPPAFCGDCGRPISRRAIRCRRCAGRVRADAPPVADPEPPAWLRPEDVAWIRANGRRYNAVRLAELFDVPVGEIRAILNAARADAG
jgi:hypothetical protein